MSPSPTSAPIVGWAEAAFREAFVRLCVGRPINLPKGAMVSQNNVAKEAGRDPTALKKDRYPALVRDIQEWIAREASKSKTPSIRQELLAARRKSRSLKQRIEQLKQDRDWAQSELVQAHAKILDLTQEVNMLRADCDANVRSISIKVT